MVTPLTRLVCLAEDEQPREDCRISELDDEVVPPTRLCLVVEVEYCRNSKLDDSKTNSANRSRDRQDKEFFMVSISLLKFFKIGSVKIVWYGWYKRRLLFIGKFSINHLQEMCSCPSIGNQVDQFSLYFLVWWESCVVYSQYPLVAVRHH